MGAPASSVDDGVRGQLNWHLLRAALGDSTARRYPDQIDFLQKKSIKNSLKILTKAGLEVFKPRAVTLILVTFLSIGNVMPVCKDRSRQLARGAGTPSRNAAESRGRTLWVKVLQIGGAFDLRDERCRQLHGTNFPHVE